MPSAMEISLSTTTEVNACAAQCMKHSSLKKKKINSIYVSFHKNKKNPRYSM